MILISVNLGELLRRLGESKWPGELGKFIILLFLQSFSLVTTVEGAKIIGEYLTPIPIVNIPTYLLLGMGIQLMIFWLLTFGKRGGIKSPAILWILIIILTFCSIYTSFFSLYKGLSRKNLDERTIALEQSDRITTGILNSSKYDYTKEKNEYQTKKQEFDYDYTKEKNEYQTKKQEFDEEYKTWDSTCTQAVVGQYSKECEGVKKRLDKARENLEPLLRIGRFEEYHEKNKHNFKNLQASEIHGENKSMIADFDDVITEDVKEQQKSSEAYLFLPLEKLSSGDQYAVTALLIAFLVDGIAILFGMDDKNNGNKFRDIFIMFSRNFRNEAHSFLPKQISFFSHIITNIISSLSGAIQKLISVIFSGIRKIFHPFAPTKNVNTLQIEGTRQEFIDILLDSLDDKKNEGHPLINKKQLALYSSENDSFKRGYQTLIERMLILEWIKRIDENYYEIIEYVKFHNWYVKERNKMTGHDIHSVSHSDKFYTIVSIPKQKGFLTKIIDDYHKKKLLNKVPFDPP
jgi:hypothetical protein